MLIASGVYILYVDPTYNEIKALLVKQETIQNYKKDADLAKQKLDTLAAVEASFPPDYIVKLRMLLPEEIDSTKLIIDVNAMAERDGLHIKSPSVSVVDNASKGGGNLPYVKHTITFSVKAPYAVFRSFLRDMEGNLALRDLSAITFSSQSSDDDLRYRSPELIPHDYNVTFVTYSLR